MKLTNLKFLKEQGFNIPKFMEIDIDHLDDLKSLNKTKRYAVRSNCFIEDTENKAHAGEFKTLLNVSYSNLEKAIFDVKSSYKGKNGTVIIQEMVKSEISGVVFTINPLGILSELVIVYAEGLGCNVVDDRVKSNTIYYDRESDRSYTELNDKTLVLDEEILNELVYTSLNIEKTLGFACDIEFGIEKNKIYILQARPITNLEIKEKVIFDNSNIVESYPGVSLDLTQSFSREIYYEVFKHIILRLTKDKHLVESLDYIFRNMVDSYNGRMYYNITNWYTILKLLPCSSFLIKIWQKSLGIENKEVSNDIIKVKLKTKLNIIINFIKLLHDTPIEMYKLNKYFKKQLKYYEGLIERTEGIEGLLEIYKSIKKDLGSKWDITLANDMYTFIYSYLADKDSISDIKGMASKKPLIALDILTNTAKKYGIYSERYKDERDSFISKYGDRCVGELKLETKTYRTNPEILDDLVQIRCFDKIVRQNRKNTKEKIGYFTKKARLGIKNREESRLNRSIIFGMIRCIMLKIGKQLKENGKIEDKRDIFYLRLGEITKYESIKDYKELVAERKGKYIKYKELPTQERVIFANKKLDKTVNKCYVQENIKEVNKLYGVPTSNGRVEGKIIKVVTPDNNLDVKDKIIVAESTDPGWVYLIEKCKGIIVERGSLLSHTAIISRELKKPAIVNVKDAMSLLKNDMVVELDAYNGKITIRR